MTADFKMYARYGIGPDAEWVEEPKYSGSPIRFVADEQEADSYTWYLGLDTITGVSDLQRTINDLPPGMYSAALVVEKTPNLDCFPNDDGRDSLYQTFEKIEICDQLSFGKFKGLRNGVDQDSVIIETFFADPITYEMCIQGSYFITTNLLGSNDTIPAGGYGTYSHLFLAGDGSAQPRGELVVDKSTLEVEFNYELDNAEYSFNGIKID